MAVAKGYPDLIYVAGQIKSGSQLIIGVYKSTDGGKNWKSYKVKPQKGVAYALAVDPKNPNNIYTGGYVGDYKGTLFKSTNGGQAWKELGAGTFGKKYDYIEQIVIDPTDSSRIYVVTDRGLYMSSNFGSSWTSISDSSWGSYANINYVAVDPKAPKKIYAARYSGVYFSPDRGGTWTALDNKLTSSSVQCLALNQAKSYLFAGTQGGGIYRNVVKKLK